MSVPELAAEDSFIRWVSKGENHQRWAHWQEQNPEKSKVIAEAKQIVQSIASLPSNVLSSQEKNDLWNNINLSIQQRSSSKRVKTYSFIRWSLVAAAVLALLVWINTLQGTQEIMAQAGDKKEITLPESSHVILNADTRIIYKKEKFTDQRELTMKGEAFFQVEPGSSFTVKTEHGTVTVLGTSFNVISRPGIFEVSCYTGKVRVTNSADKMLEIAAGEKVIDKKPDMELSTFTPTVTPSWTEGKFLFDNEPLSVVMDELERQYDVRVHLPANLQDVKYTGLFESGNLQNALHIITWPLHLRYKMKGKSVVISE